MTILTEKGSPKRSEEHGLVIENKFKDPKTRLLRHCNSVGVSLQLLAEGLSPSLAHCERPSCQFVFLKRAFERLHIEKRSLKESYGHGT